MFVIERYVPVGVKTAEDAAREKELDLALTDMEASIVEDILSI